MGLYLCMYEEGINEYLHISVKKVDAPLCGGESMKCTYLQNHAYL